ncbi:MAG: hypothetical protein N2651_10125 [Fimbriimonadales bacterium]|nr:hypothetical protein [Fimbriimonadales bacterium]
MARHISLDYLPRALGELLLWFANFVAKIGEYKTLLDISEAELEQLRIDYEALRVVVLGHEVRQRDAQEWTRYRDWLLFGTQDTPAPPLPTPGAVGTLPHGARGAIVRRLRRFVARLKTHPNYTPAIGEDLGIMPRRTPLSTKPPRLRAISETGYRVRLEYAMRGHALIEIAARREGEAEFTSLGYDVRSPFIDARPPLQEGTREIRDYRARYVDADHQPLSEWSAPVSAVAQP